MSALVLRDVNKAFGNLIVTRNVELDVQIGERHVIIGPNGAGKTSLINQIGGQIEPDSGRIFVCGHDVTGLAPERRLSIGLSRTFQKNTLFQKLTAFENVRLGVQARFGNVFDFFSRTASLSEINNRAYATLKRMNLHELADRPVSALSYGDQRQLEIAIALAGDPKVLLLDEPTSGLSPAETQQIIGLIRSLPSDITILMIEHDMEVVFSIADRITVLYYGEVLVTDTPTAVSTNPRVREVYLGTEI
jgi:branched-chain amino acid transport system ATP-binding protein